MRSVPPALAGGSICHLLTQVVPTSLRFQISDIKPIFVRHNFAKLNISLQQSEIHGPAVARGAVMIILFRPAGVFELDVDRAVCLFEHKNKTTPLPISIGCGELKLELTRRIRARNHRAPFIALPETKLVLSPQDGPTGRALGPPTVQACWRSDRVKYLLE